MVSEEARIERDVTGVDLPLGSEEDMWSGVGFWFRSHQPGWPQRKLKLSMGVRSGVLCHTWES